MGAAIERAAAHEGLRLVGDADLDQYLAVERAFADRMIVIVGAVNGIVGTHADAVGVLEDALAPRLQKIAVSVKNQHRTR